MAKILFALPTTSYASGVYSGVYIQASRYAKALNGCGYDVQFMSPNAISNDVSHIFIFQHHIGVVRLIDKLRSRITNVKIVFCPIYDPRTQYSILRTLARCLPCEKFGVYQSQRELARAIRQADVTLVRSSWELAALKGCHGNLELCKLIVPNLYSGDKASVSGRDIDFLFVGHVDNPRKNVRNLVHAAEGIAPVTLVGRLDHKAFLTQLGSSNFTYLGTLNDDSLRNTFARARVLCLPSYYEGVGQVGLEAMSMGCQVLVTAVGGTKDYFGSDAVYIENPSSRKEIKQKLAIALRKSDEAAVGNEEYLKALTEESVGARLEEIL